MLTLVVGGAASGKSEFAESLVAGFPRYYLATMEPWDDEDRRRILRHREMRREKGFETVECYHHLERLALPGRGWVLLECLTNLLANELAEEDPEGLILRGVEHLLAQSREVVVVSGDVFADGEDYPAETRRYLRLLARLNRRLADRADRVAEVAAGIVIWQKGGAL